MTEEVEKKTDFWSWDDDLYNRGAYAKFLTDYLRAKTKNAEECRPFCMALDADWGAGKTFFVDHWIDTLNKQGAHLCFKFNAWEADFQTDPLIAFMAEFKAAIEKRFKDVGGDEFDLVKRAETSLKNATKSFGKLLAPMSKAILRGMIEKALPGVADAAVEIIQANGSTENGGLLNDALEGALSGSAEYITKALDEQISRKKLLEDFQTSITTLLRDVDALNSEERLPVFVFVDELDRCRPNFAVELLEGIKHVFNTKGLCFVVATNLDQLSHAVTAIYGNGFDGRSYLSRFFDNTYRLPKVESGNHIRMLLSNSEINKTTKKLVISPSQKPDGSDFSIGDALAEVSNAFELEFRDREKYMLYIESVIASSELTKCIHVWWLAILTALKIKDSEFYVKISMSSNLTGEDMAQVLSRIPAKFMLSVIDSSDRFHSKLIPVKMNDIFGIYAELLGKKLEECFDDFNSNRYSIIKGYILRNEINGVVLDGFTSIRKYPPLIDCAGHLDSSAN